MKKIILTAIFLLATATVLLAEPRNSPPYTEKELHTALKSASPGYTGKATVYKGKDGKIWGVDVSNCKISTLEPLRGMALEAVACSGNSITSLSPLAGMKLKQCNCNNNPIQDLSPLSGMPLWTIEITGTNVTNLTPLKGMSLQQFAFIPEAITEGMDVLREMKSLIIIFTEADSDVGKGQHLRVGTTPEKFWPKYDNGEFNKKTGIK